MKTISSLLIINLLFSLNTYAGTGTGKVTGILPFSKSTGEKIFFIAMEQKVDSPSCNTTNRFVLSDTDPSYNINVSALLAAYQAGSSVKVKGKNTCTVWSNSEDVSRVCFGDIAC